MPYSPLTQHIPRLQEKAIPGADNPTAAPSELLWCYWSPLQLGFSVPANNIPFVGGKGSVSKTINLLGCNELVLIAKRTLAANPPAADALRAFIWPQFSDGAASLVKSDNLFCFNSSSNGYAPVTSGFGTYIYCFPYAAAPGSGGSGNYTGASPLGFAKIAVIGFGTAGDLSFTWEMWGQS